MKQRARRRKTSRRYSGVKTFEYLRLCMWKWTRALQHAQADYQRRMNDLRALVLLCHPPLDHHVGDYVTRGGDDVQLVTFISDDGCSGSYTCVVAPQSGWCAVGDEESNLTRRYQRVDYRPAGPAPLVTPQIAADSIRAIATRPPMQWPSLSFSMRQQIWRMVQPHVAQWPEADQVAFSQNTLPRAYFTPRMLEIADAIAAQDTNQEQSP